MKKRQKKKAGTAQEMRHAGHGTPVYWIFVARALLPAAQLRPLASEYIARSTTMGCALVDSMTADTSALASARPRPGNCSWLTQMLVRDVGGSL